MAIRKMLSEKEASEFLNLSESWLRQARMNDSGPRYVRLRRTIRYPSDLLEEYVRDHMVDTDESRHLGRKRRSTAR